MSTQPRSEKSPEFVRRRVRDEIQSICMRCFLSVRAAEGESLKQAERQHLLICPSKRDLW
jgi:hypothetical protein